MANKSYFVLPTDLSNTNSLRRYLELLAIKIDELYGNRGTDKAANYEDVKGTFDIIFSQLDKIDEQLNNLNNGLNSKLNKDGSIKATGELQYSSELSITSSTTMVHKKYVDDNFTNNPQQDTIAKLDITKVTRGSSYDQTEAQSVADQVKDVADKLDLVIDTLKNSNIIT